MIVITTPTGQIGRQILENVLDRTADTAVRVIARDPARLSPRARERVAVVQGSHDDAGVVKEAFAGADAVFWLVPPNPRAESVQGHVLDFVQPLCEAINSNRVARVVAVSSLGRGVARNAGHISATFAMDDLIERTGVSYRSLCPPGFMENTLRQVESIRTHGLYLSLSSPDRKLPICATRDIAAVAARLLLDESWSGQEQVPLFGPEDLSGVEMAQIMTELLERPVRFQQVPAEEFRANLVRHGMTEAWAQGIVDLSTAVERGIYQVDPGTPPVGHADHVPPVVRGGAQARRSGLRSVNSCRSRANASGTEDDGFLCRVTGPAIHRTGPRGIGTGRQSVEGHPRLLAHTCRIRGA
jgi:uncharacterized protein YbjT (DUF2867 family)